MMFYLKNLSLKTNMEAKIHELELIHYKEKKELEMKILELEKNYEHCQEEKSNMKSDNTFQSVFSLLLVTVGGLLASSSFIGWIVILIGFIMLLKDKFINHRD